jgi:methyl-accepting chemotaxis protein
MFALKANTSLTSQAITIGVGVILIALVSWLVGAKLKSGLRLMIRATAKADGAHSTDVGISEFDSAARQLSDYVQRWSEAVASARQQTHDVETLVAQLDRRLPGRDLRPSSAGEQLRQFLEGIMQNVDAELHQVFNCAQEILSSVGEIADGADDQSGSVTKTTTYADQMSTNIEAVVETARNLQGAVVTVRDTAKESDGCVAELKRGVERLGVHLEVNERKFRSLTDHVREIGTMIETIGGIASRTDMLALNASIESVRAGEHGKGFAVVADEVHRLAEQTAHATREVAAMLESTQLETRESIRDITAERQEVEREMERVGSVQKVIESVIEVSNDSALQLGEIPTRTDQQLLTIRNIMLAVEQIANITKLTRSQAEKARWTTKALSKITSQFDSVLAPLRGCADRPSQTSSAAPAQVLADASFDGQRRPNQESNLADPALETRQEELEAAVVR